MACDDGGGRSGNFFMRSGFGVDVRLVWLCEDMAVLDRNRVTGGGCVCRGILADCDRFRRVAVGGYMGDGGAVPDPNDTDLVRSGGVGAACRMHDLVLFDRISGEAGAACRMHDLLLLDRINGAGECIGECIDVGESMDDMAESDRKDTCLRSAFFGDEGSDHSVSLRGTGFVMAE